RAFLLKRAPPADDERRYGYRTPPNPTTVAPHMAWSPEEISKFQDIVAQLASETHLAKPGSDEGLLPIYSLVNEITGSLPADPHLAVAVEAIHEMLQPMLDEAQPFDAPTIEAMRGFARWCGDALSRMLDGQPVKSFLATSDRPVIPAPSLSIVQPADEEP